ncbi:uncharacterized protein JCM10292_004532 [Rhodotorula paludigena]|uniref:uncharacterized protein n=1 Tax=Rhodotorula paludigena TaxID=86838 RepID=UPI00317CB299
MTDIATPTSFNLPRGSTLVQDVDEEIFLLYTRKLQVSSSGSGSAASDEQAGDKGGLGFHSSTQEILPVSLTIRDPLAAQSTSNERLSSKGARGKGKKGQKKDEVVVQVDVHQALDALRNRKGDTGSVVWRLSLNLAQYLLQQHHFPSPACPALLPDLSTSTILELGSGTGFLGVALRSIWQGSSSSPARGRWIFSDQLVNLPLVMRNLRGNGVLPAASDSARTASRRNPSTSGGDVATVEVLELDWLAEAAAWDANSHSLHASGFAPLSSSPSSRRPSALETPPDLILAVDCIYNPSLSAPLAKTILRHAGANTVVVVASELRDEEPLEEFLRAWQELGSEEQGWRIARVGWDDEAEKVQAGKLASSQFVVWVGRQEQLERDKS